MSSNKINNYHSRRADENAAAVPLFALVKWPRIPLGRYAKRNGNFVLVAEMSGGLETYGQHELIQVINDALIETIEL